MERPVSPLRLQGYDYRSPGAYFVTIRFEVNSVNNAYADLKRTIQSAMYELEKLHEEFRIDCWVLMPDHLHFVCNLLDCTTATGQKSPPRPLGFYIRQLKSKVTFSMNRAIGVLFKWRPDYYEHIVRNEKALTRIREYINHNPVALEDKRNIERR